MKGILISFEGPEGSGKTTQARLLWEYLCKNGYKAILTNEPGGTSIGRRARSILLDPKHKRLSSLTELFLYLADRAQHVEEVIRPGLEEGKVVICDRFIDATLAYQGYGRGLPLDLIERLNLITTQGLRPDLTIILDVKSALKEGKDRIEKACSDFHNRVRYGYYRIADKEPDRVKIIQVNGSVDLIQSRIRGYVDGLLSSRRR